jgi:serine/threonine-protein kinase
MKPCTKCGQENGEDALFCPRCGNSLKGAGADPLIGTVVADRYVLVEKIGEGRSGVIYRGEHVTLRRKVAVKILHRQLSEDEAAIERFRREATTVCEIDNDHILEVIDFGRAADGRLFFAMELLDGEPLSKLLEREKRLPVPQVIDILTQAGEALMEAHALGYVHRDLRPRNLFLTRKRGKSDFVKLLDFGLAKLILPDAEPGTTVMGFTFGDPRYISPEQARGETVDRRADLYSLGVVAFEMLTGEAPYQGARAADIIEQHLTAKVPSVRAKRSDCPEWLDQVVQRALAKPPEKRFITVLRMNECLRDQKAPSLSDAGSSELAATEPFAKVPGGVAAQAAKMIEPQPAAHTLVPGAGPTATEVRAAADDAKTQVMPQLAEKTVVVPELADRTVTDNPNPPAGDTGQLPRRTVGFGERVNGAGPASAVPQTKPGDSQRGKSKKQLRKEEKKDQRKSGK